MTQPILTLLTTGSAGATSTPATASITVAENEVCIIAVSLRAEAQAGEDVLSISGFDRMDEVAYETATGNRLGGLFRAKGPISGAQTITYSGAGSPVGWTWVVSKAAIVPLTGTNGSDAVGTVAADRGVGTPGDGTVPGTPAAWDITIAVLHAMDDTLSIVSPSGFVNLGNSAGGETKTYVDFDVDRATTFSYTWSGAGAATRSWATQGFILRGIEDPPRQRAPRLLRGQPLAAVQMPGPPRGIPPALRASADGTAGGALLVASASSQFGSAAGEQSPTQSGAIVSASASLIGGAAGGGAGGQILGASASMVGAGQAGGGAGGQTLAASASLIPGAASGGATAAGQTVTVTTSLQGSGQAGGGAAGTTQTVTASLIPGSASGGGSATAPGVTVSAQASLIAGAASGEVNGTAAGATVAAQAALLDGAAGGGAGGQVLPATASLIPGTATAGSQAPGATVVAIASLIAGSAAVDDVADGVTLNAQAQLLPGSASGTGSSTAPGATIIVLAQFVAGLPAVDLLGSTPGYRTRGMHRTRVARGRRAAA